MEVWKAIPGYEGLYEVSDLGQVKRLARLVVRNQSNGNYVCKEIILRPGFIDGYPSVVLTKDGIKKTFRCHQLVMLAFVGPCPVGQEVLHGDGKRGNSKLDNLRYGTRRENMMDAIAHGTMAGVNNGNAKLTTEKITHIIDAYQAFEKKLAAEVGISLQTLRDFRMRRTYNKRQR